eukprot:COSAG06_NODE_8662_length_2103_cov_1.534930_3_plen_85_part_00
MTAGSRADAEQKAAFIGASGEPPPPGTRHRHATTPGGPATSGAASASRFNTQDATTPKIAGLVLWFDPPTAKCVLVAPFASIVS